MTGTSAPLFDCIHQYIKAVLEKDGESQAALFEEAALRSDLGQTDPDHPFPFITRLVGEISDADTLKRFQLGLHEPAVRALFERIDPAMRAILSGVGLPPAPREVTPLRFDYAAQVSAVEVDCWIRDYRGGFGSAKCDLSVRFCQALAQGGWAPRFRSLGELSVTEPLAHLVDIRPDSIAMIDVDYLLVVFSATEVHQFLSEARRRYRRVIVISFDSWSATTSYNLQLLQDEIDIFWCLVPTLPLLANNPKLASRTTLMAFPAWLGNEVSDFSASLEAALSSGGPLMSFRGQVGVSSAGRAYWFLASAGQDDRIDYAGSDYGDDHLDAAESHNLYIKRLTATPACLNFGRRIAPQSITTGRVFDVMQFGRLLIEETCFDTRHYFVPNEHYLEMGSYRDVLEITSCLTARDPRLAEIVRAGGEYHRKYYSAAAIVRHLTTLID
jgi:hypothetical protein